MGYLLSRRGPEKDTANERLVEDELNELALNQDKWVTNKAQKPHKKLFLTNIAQISYNASMIYSVKR